MKIIIPTLTLLVGITIGWVVCKHQIKKSLENGAFTFVDKETLEEQMKLIDDYTQLGGSNRGPFVFMAALTSNQMIEALDTEGAESARSLAQENIESFIESYEKGISVGHMYQRTAENLYAKLKEKEPKSEPGDKGNSE